MLTETKVDSPAAPLASSEVTSGIEAALRTIESREISESSDTRHRNELIELARRLMRIMDKTGVSAVWNDNPDLTFDEAFERLHKRRRSSPVLGNLVMSFNEVYRSAMAALSFREDIVGVVLTISPALSLIADALEKYATARPGEVDFEATMAASCCAQDLHNAERDQFIADELRGCSSDLTKSTARLLVLAEALSKERIEAVRAKVYSDTGGGSPAEMAMRTTDRGIDPALYAALLSKVDLPPKNCRGFRRKQTMRQRWKTAARNALARANRTREAMFP